MYGDDEPMKRVNIVKKITVKQQQILAIVLCAFFVVLTMGISFWSNNPEGVKKQEQEQSVTSSADENSNLVLLNLHSTKETSQETWKKTSNSLSNKNGNRVVENDSSKTTERRNVVEANATSSPANVVSGVLEDYGMTVPDEDCIAVTYQYPVILGGDIEQNFNGKQKQQNVVRKMCVETEPEEAGEEGTVSGSSIMESDASVTGAAVRSVTESAIESVSGANITSEQLKKPQVLLQEDMFNVMSSEEEKIYCTNQSQVMAHIVEGSAAVEKTAYAYGDIISYIPELESDVSMMLPDNFFGQLLMYCVDENGTSSELLDKNVLVDQSPPKICFANSEIYTAPYNMRVDIVDTGHIMSGIDKISCTVNGEPYELNDLQVKECVNLGETLKVSSKISFSLPLSETGSYDISVEVTDHAGNVTVEENKVSVTPPELVAVYMPKDFTIHIDPQQLLGKEQVFSDDIILKNVSGFDVKVIVKEVNAIVKDEVSQNGVRKDCDLYLLNPENGTKIKLKKGKNIDVLSYQLPSNESGDLANLKFVGDTSAGSDTMWKSSDISIDVELAFEKWN